MGSFLDCMAWRVVHGESVWKGRSHCDACGHLLGVRDLFPVISYLVSGGTCRYCGKKISSRHLWNEIISSMVFVTIVCRFGVGLQAAEYLLLACALLACSFADLEDYLIPDRFLVFAIVVRALFILRADNVPAALGEAILGGVSISASVLIVALIMEKLLKKDAMGGGDVKLLFVTGLYFGWQRNFLCLMLGCVFGVAFAVLALSRPSADESGQFPWGPSIAVAAWVTMLYGREIIDWYITLVSGGILHG